MSPTMRSFFSVPCLTRAILKPRRYASTTSTLEKVGNFWDKITLDEKPDGFQVKLAGQCLRTPAGNLLQIPRNKPILAHLIAQEWSVLPSLKLKSHLIPLTSLAARAVDITPTERKEATAMLLPYVDTDTLVVLAPHKDCEGALRKAQDALFPPVISDACKVWQVPSLTVLDQETQLFGNYQQGSTKLAIEKWINSLDPWRFASLERATTASKSLIIGMNVALAQRPVEELAILATLDVKHQTEVWGEVEDTHDVDHADIRRLLGAAYINALET